MAVLVVCLCCCALLYGLCLVDACVFCSFVYVQVGAFVICICGLRVLEVAFMLI